MRFISAMREAFPELQLLGMTATPGRTDGAALDQVFDQVVFERNLLDMIKGGYLVPPKGYRVNLGLNLDLVGSAGGDFVQRQLSKLMDQPMVNRAIVEAWCKYAHNRKTIVFAVDIKHTLSMRDEFKDAGYATEHIDGKMSTRTRGAVLKRFREGVTKILVNCEVLTEGFDEPSIEAVLFARPTQSQMLHIQTLGRGLRLYPLKTECLVIDCVGNSERHGPPIQLAGLAGFDPERRSSGSSSGGPSDGSDDSDADPLLIPTVINSNVTGVEFDLTGHSSKARYQWRETSLGWVLQVPRIGYYLVAWSSKQHTRATIRFYDQRPGKRQSPAVDVVAQPIEFPLAYGLVESEMDRILNARANRGMARRSNGAVYEDPYANDREFRTKESYGDMPPEVNFVDLDEGTEEQLEVPEALVLRDAAWRTRKPTASQLEFLRKLGVKEKSLPDTAGEASDLITILRIEKDAKLRLPATPKQIAYLRIHHLPVGENPTKGAAASVIWKHRKKVLES
jgi:hypothetical protein